MKAKILISSSRALCMIVMTCMLAASAPKPAPNDHVLQVSKNGLEATLKIQTCDDKYILVGEWKNTNAQTAVAVLSLKAKADQSAILTLSVSVAGNSVKTETCDNVDLAHREVAFSDFADVQVELILAN